MGAVITLIIVAIVIFIIYTGYKGNQDLKYVESFGGLKKKYNTLIQNLMSEEKMKLNIINSNKIEIGYNFIGGGYVFFRLIEMDKKLQIKYQSKDMVDGIQNIVWNFDESKNQDEMYEIITKELVVHNLMLRGMTREEAIEAINEIE